MTTWQQVLALDARYNVHRSPNSHQTRSLYIKRRTQLLREHSKKQVSSCYRRASLVGTASDSSTYPSQVDTFDRKSYLLLRSRLLAERYGAYSEVNSLRSRTVSLRSVHFASEDQVNLRSVEDRRIIDNMSFRSDNSTERKSSSDQYAFVGMHHIFDQHKLAVTTLRFAHDDKSRLALASLDGNISICQVIPSPATVICTLQGHHAGVTDFVWSQSNDIILSCSLDGSSRIWNIAEGHCVRVIHDCHPHTALLCCLFQPLNQNWILTGNSRHMIQVMNLSTGKVTKDGTSRVLGRVLCMAFHSSGSLLWAGDDNGYIFSFSFHLATGKIVKLKRLTVSEGSPITCMSLRTWITKETREPLLLVNCAVNALCVFRITNKEGSLLLKRKLPLAHKSETVKSIFCPLLSFRHGACVVSGSEDQCIYIYDVLKQDTKQSVVNKLQGHTATVLDVTFNYDESMLASSDCVGTVIIWKRAVSS